MDREHEYKETNEAWLGGKTMLYTTTYHSPLGKMLIAGDDVGLTGLWFEGQKNYAKGLSIDCKERDIAVFHLAKRWLDIYFSGKEPDFMPPLHMVGTPFELGVWQMLGKIPYGKTITYGQIAKEIAKQQGLMRMSSQAVGGAVGRNKISIMVPCHRVVGAKGNLTGYAGGLDRKAKLLKMEKICTESLLLPN